MDSNDVIRKWSELSKMQVFIPSEGRSVGWLKDFYFKAGTNAIYALCIGTRLDGDRSLPVTGIQEFNKERVLIPSAQMLTKRLPPLPQSEALLGKKVVSESGSEVGTVGEVYLATDHPVALRIAAFELASGSGRRAGRTFTADEVVTYDDHAVIVYDRAARRLR